MKRRHRSLFSFTLIWVFVAWVGGGLILALYQVWARGTGGMDPAIALMLVVTFWGVTLISTVHLHIVTMLEDVRPS